MLPFLRSDLAEFVAYQPHTAANVAAIAPELIDHLDTNESPYDLPAELKHKLGWMFEHTLHSNRYPDGGHEALKQAIAEYVTESAQLPAGTLGAAHITVGNGSDELIRSVLIATCLGGEGSILVANPTFSMYRILAKTLGIPAITVDRQPTDFAIELAAAQAAIAQTQQPPIRVVFVVHPNSPTANALTEAEMDWLRHLPEHILVVIDEAYFEFSQTTVVPELLNRPNWLVLRTFSKAFRLAAHRVGYGIAHPELIATLEKVRLPYNLPSFAQVAALLALAHRQELLMAIRMIWQERDRLSQALQQIPTLQIWPSNANFLYGQLKPAVTDQPEAALAAITQALKAEGTWIRHIGKGVRLTIGTPAENNRLLLRLQQALQDTLSPR